MVHLQSLTLLFCASLAWAAPQIIPTPSAVLPGGPPPTPANLQQPSKSVPIPVAEGTRPAQGTPSALPKAYLTSLPLNISIGGDVPVVYSGNSSLLQAKPNIQSEVNKNMSLIDHLPSNISTRDVERRDECLKGILGTPVTFWSNIALLIQSTCDGWFPNGQTYWMPSGSFGTNFMILGFPNPNIEFYFQTVNIPWTNVRASMTSQICQAHLLGLLNYAQFQSGAHTCAIWPYVNEIDDFDDQSAGIHFEILVY